MMIWEFNHTKTEESGGYDSSIPAFIPAFLNAKLLS